MYTYSMYKSGLLKSGLSEADDQGGMSPSPKKLADQLTLSHRWWGGGVGGHIIPPNYYLRDLPDFRRGPRELSFKHDKTNL